MVHLSVAVTAWPQLLCNTPSSLALLARMGSTTPAILHLHTNQQNPFCFVFIIQAGQRGFLKNNGHFLQGKKHPCFYQPEIKLEQPKLTGTVSLRLEQEKSTEASSRSRLILALVERSLAQQNIATSLKCKAKQTKLLFFSSRFRRFQDSLHDTLQRSMGLGGVTRQEAQHLEV